MEPTIGSISEMERNATKGGAMNNNENNWLCVSRIKNVINNDGSF